MPECLKCKYIDDSDCNVVMDRCEHCDIWTCWTCQTEDKKNWKCFKCGLFFSKFIDSEDISYDDKGVKVWFCDKCEIYFPLEQHCVECGELDDNHNDENCEYDEATLDFCEHFHFS